MAETLAQVAAAWINRSWYAKCQQCWLVNPAWGLRRGSFSLQTHWHTHTEPYYHSFTEAGTPWVFGGFCCCFLRKELNHKKTRWEMSSLKHICLKFMKKKTKESKSDHHISAAHAEWKTWWEKCWIWEGKDRSDIKNIHICRFLFKPGPQHCYGYGNVHIPHPFWHVNTACCRAVQTFFPALLTSNFLLRYVLSYPTWTSPPKNPSQNPHILVTIYMHRTSQKNALKIPWQN